MKYPIGIQSFSEIRDNDYIYIDKTDLIHRLISEGKYYFLSRPRRFGKSLLLSTLEALLAGRRELFRGLAIDTLYRDWKEYPVFHLDLNVESYTDKASFERRLDNTLNLWESRYGISTPAPSLSLRFENVIREAYNSTGLQVVILIDEYDKPLVRTITKDHSELHDYFRSELQAFYGVLKSLDPFIKFAILTGVTRFSKVSIFSGLNNLKDITLDARYNNLCGITETEITRYFAGALADFANAEGLDIPGILAVLKENYDGYHFAAGKVDDIYNPFSLLHALDSQRISEYWYETATPQILADIILEGNYSLSTLDGASRSEMELKGSDLHPSDIIPLLFQTGYLTIKGFTEFTKKYILGFPNREVEKSFLEYLVKFFTNERMTGSMVADLSDALLNGDTDKFMTCLKTFFADFPYDQIPDMEVHYQNVIFIILKIMGFYVRTEYRTSHGGVDAVVETPRFIYVMEFKLGGSPLVALKQVEEKGYAEPFLGRGKSVVCLGIVFDKTTRAIKSWRQLRKV